jgi:tetratricopeptide (TPR) repeat protein
MSADNIAIKIPSEEAARQAEAALLGYSYQLYQTVLAWLSLGSNEVLHIEFAEDFAVSDDGSLKMTQVKNTKAALTIRSKAVAALIRAVWVFQEANPGRDVVAALVTTGKIGKEKGTSFPGTLSGLSYWRVAAREHSDVEPMRKALLDLDLPNDVKSFLKRAAAADIRERILRPIRWFGSSPSHDEIESDLQDRLVHFGAAQGVGAQDSKNALSALIVELLKCARRPANSRFVTAADLLTIFQKNTYVLIPPSAFERIGITQQGTSELAGADLAIRDAASIPLPPRPAMRPELVDDLHGSLVVNGKLWLHGSSGLGKTTIALLLARRQNVVWMFSDLRDLEPRALRLALARLSATFEASGALGLILDDLPSDPDNATILAIKRVARAVTNSDGVLVITGVKPPPPTLSGGLGLANNAVRAVPYLTEDEVGQIVDQAGGDRRVWGRLIFAFCGGHPQLVDARVVGLRQRGWPASEQLADLKPSTAKAGDLERERGAVRARLLRELDADSRELLLRLSLLMNNFDRSIMLTVVGVLPAIPQAGIIFDALVGPWIEQVGADRYRLSPLLRDSGEVGLAKGQRTGIKSAVVEHLMARRPFPADQLLQVFIFAYGLKLIPALSWFSGILVHTATRDPKTFKRLAEEVSVFAMVDRGPSEPLVAEEPRTSFMLRYAQFRVAIANEDGGRAVTILDRLMSEVEHLSGEVRSNNLGMVLATALIERSVPLPPARWLEMLKTLVAIPEMRRVVRKRPSHTDSLSGLTLSASPDEMMFTVRATALSGIDQLCELVAALDAMEETTRERYLKAVSNLVRSVVHIVASAWLSEVKSDGFDSKAAGAKLAALYNTASRWRNADMAVELACAQAVMLDEYAGDMKSALDVLAAAQAHHPRDYRISRQRQKVYYRNGDHALALAEFESFADSLLSASPLERAFTVREAGRSAAEVGDFDRAGIFFEQAWEAASKCGDHMLPMVAGLLGDRAVLAFHVGDVTSALGLMARALAESEAIDPTAGLKEHYCILILLAAILWMRGAAADWPVERQAMVVGMCSNPEPHPEFRERRLPQRLLLWYELAELEAESGNGRVVLSELRRRTAKGGLLPLETMLVARLMGAALRDLDVDRFADLLSIYPRAIVEATSTPVDRRPEAIFEMPVGTLKPIAPEEWVEGRICEATTSAVLVFLVTAACSGRNSLIDTLCAQLQQKEGLGAALAPLFDTIFNPSDKRDDMIAAIAGLLSRMLRSDFVFDAADAFKATVHLVQFLSAHPLGKTAAGPVVGYFAQVWRDILENRTFSVRNPVVTGPYILKALSRGDGNLARLANIVLASEAAVRARLSDELRTQIRAKAELKRTLLKDLQASI